MGQLLSVFNLFVNKKQYYAYNKIDLNYQENDKMMKFKDKFDV